LLKQDDRSKFAPLAAAGVVLGAGGYLAFRHGRGKEVELKEAKKALATVRDKDKRDVLVAQNEQLDKQTDAYKFTGVAGISLGVGIALMAVLVGARVRLRHAAALALALPFTWVGYRAVDYLGIVYLVPFAVVAIALIGWIAMGTSDKSLREIAEFRRFPTRRELPSEDARQPGYRAAFVDATQLEQQKLLAEVTRLPPSLERVLPLIGEGRPLSYFQLKRDLAYVAFVESDAFNASDYVTVLMLLDETGPRFVARPLPIVDGKRDANTGLRFKEDRAFSNAYLVEVSAKGRAEAQDFISPVVRDELLAFPSLWLQVEGNVMALTLFGDYDAGATDKLVDIADVLFAEYGADGGPSLLEPDDAEVLGAPALKKKKKKKKKQSGVTPAALPSV